MFIEHRITAFIYIFANNSKRSIASVVFFLHIRKINGEDTEVNVVRIYGTWDESHTRIVYDPNAAQGGVPGSAPVDSNEYTIWQSEVSVMSQSGMTNADPDMVFAGWLLDRNGVVYQPGDHVAVHWPRTMIFTAQWAKAEEIVSLRYDPNGGTPYGLYPNDAGYHYLKNATAIAPSSAKSFHDHLSHFP